MFEMHQSDFHITSAHKGYQELVNKDLEEGDVLRTPWTCLILVVRKPVFGVSDQVRHKPGCAVTEDGWRLEISDLGRRGIVLSV